LRHGRGRADMVVVEVTKHDPFDVTVRWPSCSTAWAMTGALSAHPVSTTVTPSGPSHR
jgi:hypothetical protein